MLSGDLKSTSPELHAIATTAGWQMERPWIPTIRSVSATDHSETVHVTYDQSVVGLIYLRYYFRATDPLSINRATTLVGSIALASITQTRDLPVIELLVFGMWSRCLVRSLLRRGGSAIR